MQPRNLYQEDTAHLYEDYIRTGLRYRKVAEALVEIAGSIDGQSVVDLGCGTGILTRMLADRLGLHGAVTGVDASTDMLASAERTTPNPNAHFIHSPAETVDQAIKQPVDAVFSSAAFWQFQRGPTLKALARIVTPKGKLYFNLSAGFFDFKISGLADPADNARLYKQHEILAKWIWLARKRYPDRDFPPKLDPSQKASPQSLDELTHQLGQFGFKILAAKPLRFEIPRDDEYAWLKIPQWTDRPLAPLTHQERLAILDEIFADIPPKATFLGRWVAIAAQQT